VSTRHASPWLAALAFLLCLLRSAPTGACSVCLAGDPNYSSFGSTTGEAGDISFFLEARGFSKSSGPHDDREESDGHRLDLYANWTPIDRLAFTIDLPVAWNQIVAHEAGERSRSTLSGLGDVSLATSVVLWRDRPVLPSRWLEGRLWGKAPTGRDATQVDGERDPHIQPGTGSWDFGAGFAGVQRFDWGWLYGSAFYRRNQTGSLDYRYGDVVLATLALEAPLGHLLGRPALDVLTPGLGFDLRYAGYDEENGERYQDSGGAILYATPSLRIALPFGIRERPASLRVSIQLPLGQTWLHGRQSENSVWSVGVLVPF